MQRLPALLARKQIRREDVAVAGAGTTGATEVIPGAWKRFVYVTPPHEPPEPYERSAPAADPGGARRAATPPAPPADEVDRHAYTVCVLEQLHHALRRRDVFACRSDRWGDPRARLLDGDAWARAKPGVLTALGLPEPPEAHLAELAQRLDAAYRDVASRVPAAPRPWRSTT